MCGTRIRTVRNGTQLVVGQEPRLAKGVRGYAVRKRGRGLYIPLVIADIPSSGAVDRFLDSLPRDERVVFPNVLSERLAGMLVRHGFAFAQEWNEEHEEPLDIWVRERE